MEIGYIEDDFIKDEQLNEDWIINFEKTDKLYQEFYKDSLYYTNLQFIYVNKDNEIDKIKQEPFFMSSPNYISREEIIGILKKYAIDSDKRYTLLSILRYNITLDTEDVKNFAVVYLVDISEVPDFNTMYELYDPCTVMFFFRNKHIMIDLGTGNNNKINWAFSDKQELIDIIETVYRGAKKGRGLVISPKDYSTKYRY
jgi:DIM1 family U5 snRNP protein